MNDTDLQHARELADEIVRLAQADDRRAILGLADEPETSSRLSLLPERESAAARVHLESARRWRERQNKKAREKFASASKALDEMDVTLARGILQKIDWRLLDIEALDRYNDLQMAVTARTVELEEIESQLPDLPDPKRKHKYWRR